MFSNGELILFIMRWNKIAIGPCIRLFGRSAGTIAKSISKPSPSMTDDRDPCRFDRPIKTIAIVGAGNFDL